MAKATLQPVSHSIIGPLAAVVATTRHGEATLRTKYLEPGGTAAQQYYRRAFRQVDTNYAALTAAQKAGWAAYGKPRRKAAYSVYMKINLPRAYQGLPLQPNAP